MRISELFEQTVAPVPPGQGAPLPPTQPSGQQPTQANTATQMTQTTPQVGTSTGTTPPGASNPQQQQQIQQIQQASKNTLTDLDKIAAQIVGLKQKQQELQQQAQKVGL